ncbi:hypothetical protein ABZ477_06215 [Microbacterium sp. NPDC019599]|uniref:hypothetical protein n=1 Tax=Microbacterium sp. NPDC019599 TaxID=3154690 RepID=UPI0033E102DA
MSTPNEEIRPGSEIDLAIERALAGADLRAGDATTSAAFVVQDEEPAPVEDGVGGLDGGD